MRRPPPYHRPAAAGPNQRTHSRGMGRGVLKVLTDVVTSRRCVVVGAVDALRREDSWGMERGEVGRAG